MCKSNFKKTESLLITDFCWKLYPYFIYHIHTHTYMYIDIKKDKSGGRYRVTETELDEDVETYGKDVYVILFLSLSACFFERLKESESEGKRDK